MDFTKVDGGGGLSGVEAVVLAVLFLLCLVVAWQLWERYTGRARSDVSGLHLHRRAPDPPP